MQGLFSLSFDKKLYFYCFLNLCVKYVYHNLMHTKNHIIKTGFIFSFSLKKTGASLGGSVGLFFSYSKFLPN